MSNIKSEVLQAIKELIDEGVLYIDTEVDTCYLDDEYATNRVSVNSTIEVREDEE